MLSQMRAILCLRPTYLPRDFVLLADHQPRGTHEVKADRFEILVRPHMSALFRAAYRLTGNKADAEDLVQETCITANGQLAAVEACAFPSRWLLRVLYNRFIDSARKSKRAPVVGLDANVESALASDAASPEVLASQADDEHAFSVAWAQLEQTQRALLSLRAEGYGLEEIAEITGIAKDVLGPRLHRARQSLKRYLVKSDSNSEATVSVGSAR